MKLDEVAIEAGFDINSDAILLRAEQLSKSEVDISFQIESAVYKHILKIMTSLQF